MYSEIPQLQFTYTNFYVSFTWQLKKNLTCAMSIHFCNNFALSVGLRSVFNSTVDWTLKLTALNCSTVAVTVAASPPLEVPLLFFATLSRFPQMLPRHWWAMTRRNSICKYNSYKLSH